MKTFKQIVVSRIMRHPFITQLNSSYFKIIGHKKLATKKQQLAIITDKEIIDACRDLDNQNHDIIKKRMAEILEIDIQILNNFIIPLLDIVAVECERQFEINEYNGTEIIEYIDEKEHCFIL